MLRRDPYHTLAWETGKIVGNVDTNQLKNTMAAISPNGRLAFIDNVKKHTLSFCGSDVQKEAFSASILFLRINLPAVGYPIAVAFVDATSSVVVASQALYGSSLYMDRYHTLSWETGKIVGNVDTNHLKNTMTAISPNGRFIASITFTDDVKVIL
ncbi:unnamed protein product [Ilex paraguariensis]|uniref:Uncharacterized protein n=1 Tax=Ilex paraguariensis TaxID=185542 RepID=A0ABC8V4X2_9AQUA